MSWSFPIGRLLGSELRVHATFFLLLIWIGGVAWAQAGPMAALVNVVYILLLFVCVIAHEYGHALMARRFGIKTPDITLLPIGGLARLMKMPDKPAQEILVALAGPAVNVVIFFVLWAVVGLNVSDAPLTGEMGFADLPGQIAVLNLILAVFNMIPAFPMDGGRVLRAALSFFMDRVKATRIAAMVGQGAAIALGLFALISGNIFLVLIAVFVFMAAGAESSDTQLTSRARRFKARDAMIVEYEPLAPSDSLEAASAALIRTTQHEFPVIDPATRRLEGVLTRRALYQALGAEDRPRTVAQVMVRDIPSVPLTAGLEQVLDRMMGPVPAVAVTGTDGSMVGYITRENIGELMVVANARR
jgi:stage IV sporulation protein FB